MKTLLVYECVWCGARVLINEGVARPGMPEPASKEKSEQRKWNGLRDVVFLLEGVNDNTRDRSDPIVQTGRRTIGDLCRRCVVDVETAVADYLAQLFKMKREPGPVGDKFISDALFLTQSYSADLRRESDA